MNKLTNNSNFQVIQLLSSLLINVMNQNPENVKENLKEVKDLVN